MSVFLRRVLAGIVDGVVFIFFFVGVVLDILFWLDENYPIFNELNKLPYMFFISILFYFFIPELIFLTSLGKWLFGLKIYSMTGRRPSIAKLLQRSFLKVVMMFTGIGTLISLVVYGTGGYCWYDKGLDLYIASKKHGLI